MLQDGFVIAAYNLGKESRTPVVQSRVFVADQKEHVLTLLRWHA